jgi:triacylglycerol esterase/lipase EstA (alpha/beta hydrolase family)
MPKTPIILVHGYSDKGASFANWRTQLQQNGYRVEEIFTSSYATLTNEVTLEDIAEGFDLALQQQAGLSGEEPFDAIVHSTGMLVLRAWLAVYGKQRRNRLKHLIGLAPATFGSPLAHKGRSWIQLSRATRKLPILTSWKPET